MAGNENSTRWRGVPTRRTVESSYALDLDRITWNARARGERIEDLFNERRQGDVTFRDGFTINVTFIDAPCEDHEDEPDFPAQMVELCYAAPQFNNRLERIEDHDVALYIPISTNPTGRAGGLRYYMHCPTPQVDGSMCLRRASNLYLPIGRKRFACRTCHDLTYASTQTYDKRTVAIVREMLGDAAADRIEALPDHFDGMDITEIANFLRAHKAIEEDARKQEGKMRAYAEKRASRRK